MGEESVGLLLAEIGSPLPATTRGERERKQRERKLFLVLYREIFFCCFMYKEDERKLFLDLYREKFVLMLHERRSVASCFLLRRERIFFFFFQINEFQFLKNKKEDRKAHV